MTGFEIAVLIAVFIVALLFTAQMKRRHRKVQQPRQQPEYVWLAITGKRKTSFGRVFAKEDESSGPPAESAEGTYEAAYLLLMAGLRMELTMAKREAPGMGAGLYVMNIVSRARVTERVTYTTEAFRPYMDKVKSLEDFGRYAPYQEGWLTMMSLFVHPEDVDKAVRVLEDAGLIVEQPPGRHWWH